ncbi:MAG TPA: alpha/beta hydrolase [Gammaproteobacteria bacterium]|nr:alpha/beta hydrolase [Gammaproteobacteria bacterium]
MEANHLRFEVDMCGDGDKLALCLHGFPEHSISWRYQLPMLAELGYKAWAPNMRGYGNSSVPMFLEDYSPENLMADVAGLIDAAGCDEVVLIAHDWGAVIAWYFAIRQIRPLNKLIICNVPHPVPAQKAISNGFAQLKKSWYIFCFQIPGLPEMMTRMRGEGAMGNLIKKSSSNPANYPDEVIDVYNQNSSRPENLTAMVNYYRALVRGGGGKRQKDLGYPMIETPTLMLWGEDDLALTKETTYGTEDVVKDFTIRYLPRISHWVQQDAPEEVNAMMSAFLTGQPIPEMTWEPKLVLPEIS